MAWGARRGKRGGSGARDREGEESSMFRFRGRLAVYFSIILGKYILLRKYQLCYGEGKAGPSIFVFV